MEYVFTWILVLKIGLNVVDSKGGGGADARRPSPSMRRAYVWSGFTDH